MDCLWPYCVHADKMSMPIFIAGSVRNSVIKSQGQHKCPLQIKRFFSVTRTYVHIPQDVRLALDLSKGRVFTEVFLGLILKTKVMNVHFHIFSL